MTPQRLEDLVGELSNRRGSRRLRAREALVEIGAPAVPALLPLAASPSKQLRWEATKTLGAIADLRAVPALVERLADSESGIRWLAAVGLVSLGPAAIPPALRAVIARPDSQDLRRAVHHVLHDLTHDNPDLVEIISPVLAALRDIEPADAIPPKAQEALQRLESL